MKKILPSFDPKTNTRTQAVFIRGNNWNQIKSTVAHIGEGIRNALGYLPIRNYAARLAVRAKPKDYIGQIRNVFDDVTQKKWRYVQDPYGLEVVTKSPRALAKLVLALDGVGLGDGRGGGDCDCLTTALGACLLNIGFPVRLCLTARPGAAIGSREYSHVFLQAAISGYGWITVDPVLWPRQNLGATQRHSSFAVFDLYGKLLYEIRKKPRQRPRHRRF